MPAHPIKLIPLENLLVDLFNPRHPHQPSQRDAIHTIAHDQGIKLVNLAEDIADKGLNPADLPIVTDADQEGMYSVLEGNRRVTAIKLLASSQLLTSMGLPASLEARYKTLQKRVGQDIIPAAISCVVLSREDATHWIQLKHTGENTGIGIVPWDGLASQRFRGSSPALQAIQMVGESNYIDDETKEKLPKISITNVERVLSTPEARKALGVDVKSNQLIIVAPNEDDALARLSILVREVANKVVKVTDLDTKGQRVAYAEQIAAMPIPDPLAPAGASGLSRSSTTTSTLSTVRRLNPYRKTLIPRDFRLAIHHPRLNKIYHELQKINVDTYVNCCAVMFRVFIELSVDHYAAQKSISLKTIPKAKVGAVPPREKDMTLREKISAVANNLEHNHLSTHDQLRGIRSLVANREHVLSVDGLNAYVHYKEYNPTSTDLKANWDSIQEFVRAMWSV